MVRKNDEKLIKHMSGPFEGGGEVEVRNILNGSEEMHEKGRLFTHTIIYPGGAIGYHVHGNDGETYYVLSGIGEYNDNGTVITVQAGDVTYCEPRKGHGLKCVGEEPLEVIALILYE